MQQQERWAAEQRANNTQVLTLIDKINALEAQLKQKQLRGMMSNTFHDSSIDDDDRDHHHQGRKRQQESGGGARVRSQSQGKGRRTPSSLLTSNGGAGRKKQQQQRQQTNAALLMYGSDSAFEDNITEAFDELDIDDEDDDQFAGSKFVSSKNSAFRRALRWERHLARIRTLAREEAEAREYIRDLQSSVRMQLVQMCETCFLSPFSKLRQHWLREKEDELNALRGHRQGTTAPNAATAWQHHNVNPLPSPVSLSTTPHSRYPFYQQQQQRPSSRILARHRLDLEPPSSSSSVSARYSQQQQHHIAPNSFPHGYDADSSRVGRILQQAGLLEECGHMFFQHGFDPHDAEALVSITAEDLAEMGVSTVGARRRILSRLQQHSTSSISRAGTPAHFQHGGHSDGFMIEDPHRQNDIAHNGSGAGAPSPRDSAIKTTVSHSNANDSDRNSSFPHQHSSPGYAGNSSHIPHTALQNYTPSQLSFQPQRDGMVDTARAPHLRSNSNNFNHNNSRAHHGGSRQQSHYDVNSAHRDESPRPSPLPPTGVTPLPSERYYSAQELEQLDSSITAELREYDLVLARRWEELSQRAAGHRSGGVSSSPQLEREKAAWDAAWRRGCVEDMRAEARWAAAMRAVIARAKQLEAEDQQKSGRHHHQSNGYSRGGGGGKVVPSCNIPSPPPRGVMASSYSGEDGISSSSSVSSHRLTVLDRRSAGMRPPGT